MSVEEERSILYRTWLHLLRAYKASNLGQLIAGGLCLPCSPVLAGYLNTASPIVSKKIADAYRRLLAFEHTHAKDLPTLMDTYEKNERPLTDDELFSTWLFIKRALEDNIKKINARPDKITGPYLGRYLAKKELLERSIERNELFWSWDKCARVLEEFERLLLREETFEVLYEAYYLITRFERNHLGDMPNIWQRYYERTGEKRDKLTDLPRTTDVFNGHCSLCNRRENPKYPLVPP